MHNMYLNLSMSIFIKKYLINQLILNYMNSPITTICHFHPKEQLGLQLMYLQRKINLQKTVEFIDNKFHSRILNIYIY